VSVAAVAWALVSWGSGSPFPGLAVSVAACLVGFALGLVALAAGSDRGDLKIGLVGFFGNALIAVFWALLTLAIYLGSS